MVAPKIFLSHDTRDEKVARLIATTLSTICLDQVRIWFSSDSSASGGCKPGNVWVNEIESRLLSSNVILVVLTRNSLGRPWIYFESGYGFSRRKSQVIPLCFGISISDVPLPLAMFQCYEINDLNSLTQFCRKFFDRVHVRFDPKMASPILRKTAKTITSLLSEIEPLSNQLECDGQSSRAQLKICLKTLVGFWEELPIPIHRIDETGVICGVNKKWLEVFQYQREEVLGKPADFLMTSKSAQLAMLVVIPDFWQKGFCENVSYEYKKKDGTIINVVLNCIATIDEHGVRTSLSFIRPAAGDEIKRVRRTSIKYRQKLSKRATGFFEMDTLGNFTSVNNYLSKLFGYTKKASVLGKNHREVMDSGSAKTLYNVCHLMFANEIQKDQFSWELQTKHGVTVHVRTTLYFVASFNGETDHFRGTVEVVDQRSITKAGVSGNVILKTGEAERNGRTRRAQQVRKEIANRSLRSVDESHSEATTLLPSVSTRNRSTSWSDCWCGSG